MIPNHLLTTETQPIADQVMVKCSCGWRKAVSLYEVQRGGPTMSTLLRNRHQEHLVEVGAATEVTPLRLHEGGIIDWKPGDAVPRIV